MRISTRTGNTHTGLAINRFIGRHTGSLKSFEFVVNGHDEPPEEEQCKLEQIRDVSSVSNLRKSSLRNLELRVGFSLAACIISFANTLTTLALRAYQLDINGLRVLLNLFSQSPGLLKSVKLEINEFSPQVVDAMALGILDWP
jgi:hypothetical protein